MVLIIEDTGVEIRVPYDAPDRWLVASWTRATGGTVEPDPWVERLDALVGRGLREKNPDIDGRIFSSGHDARRAEDGA